MSPVIGLCFLLAGTMLTEQELAPAAFHATTLSGARLSPAALKGRPHILFFFCPCGDCKRIAAGWAGMQSKGAFEAKDFKAVGGSPASIIIFSGSTQETKQFINASGIKVVHGVADPEYNLAKMFRAMPCPSIFVSDARGVVRYSSKVSAGELQADAGILLGQTLSALRSMSGRQSTTTAPVSQRPQSVGRLTTALRPGQTLESPGSLVEQVSLVASDEHLTREYIWTNHTGKQVKIEHLLTSCGCERATLLYRGKAVKDAKLNPGDTITVRIDFGMPTSSAAKSVTAWLFSTAVEPVATMRVEATRQQ